MELCELREDEILHSGEDDDETLELIFSDNNGSFASRRALEQFKGKNRQYGNAVCPECKQSFVNAARLERHLAVHQVFGAYLCPLCGKTYKYEYNLFFHWRKTCQYLNELIKVEQRKEMDVQSLRLLVEEVVMKRNETEPVDIGISTNALFQGSFGTTELEMPIDPQSPLARACTICGILIHRNHIPQHEALHSASTETGLRIIDTQSPTGGYFCDLCGVAFRNRDNLYTHWRSSCPEIMANIEPGSELYLSDVELKAMVLNLLWRLKRVSRQSPLRAIRTNRNCMEETDPLSRNSDRKHDQYEGNSGNSERSKGPCTSSADPEGKALVFMDDYVNPADTLVDIDGELINVISADRGKWNISVDGKPLECPDCFRQFANAGRLERHISGFHSHYGAFKCLLCGHRFKYDYNLLFHYRHSCAYTKLLVGADVRKLLDAASLRKLVAHIKESEPQIRPGSSRLINVKRRPSLKAVPRNIRPVFNPVPPKCRSKRGLEEGRKCPVCGVLFYGQKSLDKHVGTVHLLNRKFLEKAITRETTSQVATSKADTRDDSKIGSSSLREDRKQPLERKRIMPRESYEENNLSEEAEAPPVLEVQAPGEVVPPPTRCIDINGEEIDDFDTEQLSEMDLMLCTGQLSLGDLVITSNFGQDIEYRIAVGTRHGAQIVLERTDKGSSLLQEKETDGIGTADVKREQSEIHSDKKTSQKDFQGSEGHQYHNGNHRENEETVEYTDGIEMVQYAEGEDAEIEYESGDFVEYEVDGAAEGQQRERVVRFVDEEGQHLVQYINEEGVQCEGYVQFIDDENGQQIVGLIDDCGEVIEFLETDNMDEESLAALKSHTQLDSGEHEVVDGQMHISDKHGDEERYIVVPGSTVGNNMPEDFMQENMLEE